MAVKWGVMAQAGVMALRGGGYGLGWVVAKVGLFALVRGSRLGGRVMAKVGD